MITVIPLTTWSSNGKPRDTLRLTETESPIGIQLSHQTAIWGPYTSQATPTSFQWQPKTYYTILQQRRPTWTKRKKFYNLLNAHTSDNIKCHDIHLVSASSTQKSPKTVTKKLQEQWAPAYYTTLPTTTDRDVSALTLQLTFDTRNSGFPAQGLGSRPGPTHWALACNLTISWSMASGLTRLGTVEPKIV